MRKICKTVFHYDELNDEAKEKARQWYLENYHDDFQFAAESIIEDAEEAAKILGIEFGRRPGSTEPKIWYRLSYSQGDGACFEGSYSYAKNAPQKIREFAPNDTELERIATQLQDLQRRHFYRLRAEVVHRSPYYYHSLSTSIDIYDDRNRDLGDDGEYLKQLLRDFMDWIYARLQAEDEYLRRDETIEEALRANDYEFCENGAFAH